MLRKNRLQRSNLDEWVKANMTVLQFVRYFPLAFFYFLLRRNAASDYCSTPNKTIKETFKTTRLSQCAGGRDSKPCLQIDLQTLHVICAVSVHWSCQANQRVKNCTIQVSTNGSTWETYMENREFKTFQENNDMTRGGKNRHTINVKARYLRFLPTAYQGSACVKTEIFEQEPGAAAKTRSAEGTKKQVTTVSSTTSRTSTTAETTTSSAAETVTTDDSVKYTTSGASTTAGTNTSPSAETTTTEGNGKQKLYLLALIAVSVLVLVLLVIIGGLIRQLRQAVRRGEDIVTDHDIPVPPVQRQESEPTHYMELRPSQVQSAEPSVYESLQSRYSSRHYCNAGFVKEKTGNDNESIYENVGAGGIV